MEKDIIQAVANVRREEMGVATWFVPALSLTLGQAVGILMVIHFLGVKDS
ncbi:MAG: hypothetical protein ABJ275_10350 [Maricaulaceae bacterium]